MNIQNRGKGRVVRGRDYEKLQEEFEDIKKICLILGLPFKNAYNQSDIAKACYSVENSQLFADVFEGDGIQKHLHARFDLVSRDPRIAENLARGGVTGVHVAIESGNEDIRNRVHRRGMTDRQITLGSEYLHANGIKMMTQNILGAPCETKEQMLQTLEMNIAVNPTFASASIFQPYPGTSALEYTRDTGQLPVQSQDELIDLFGMETFYNKSILIQDPQHKHWVESFQKFFAVAVANSYFHK